MMKIASASSRRRCGDAEDFTFYTRSIMDFTVKERFI
jgi:hypothetical protein